MSVEVTADRIILQGRCGVEEAEPLLEALRQRSDRVVVIEAERLHTALWQVLMALRPVIEGRTSEPFVIQHLLPEVLDNLTKGRLAPLTGHAGAAFAQPNTGANQ